MEAVFINNNFIPSTSLTEAVSKFFSSNCPDNSRVLFLKIFQCWTLKDCNVKAEISDEEVALFFDQLIDLVAAAYILHQANGVSQTKQEGSGHD